MRVLCELEARPSNVNFTWFFNGTNAENVAIPTSNIFSENATSTATYVPHSENVSVPNFVLVSGFSLGAAAGRE